MTRHYVLDAWAILALLQQEDPAATRVRQCLEEALANKTLLSISIINLGEVTYRIGKVKGEDAAWETLQQLRQLPLTVLQATEEAVLAAVTFKEYALQDANTLEATQTQIGTVPVSPPGSYVRSTRSTCPVSSPAEPETRQGGESIDGSVKAGKLSKVSI